MTTLRSKHGAAARGIPPLEFERVHRLDPRYGDYGSASVEMTAPAPPHLRSACTGGGRSSAGDAWSLAALNFTTRDVWVPFVFPRAGEYREALHGQDKLAGIRTDQQTWQNLPANYGRVGAWQAA